VFSGVISSPFMEIEFYALNDRSYQIMVVAKGMILAVKAEATVIGVVNNL